MKKFVILVTVVIVTISLVAGCVGQVKTYTDSRQATSIVANQEFVIALGSNPTTGYSWQESYDETMLQLVEKTYKENEEAQKDMVGIGGVEYFHFKALQAGETEITLVYKRQWEQTSLDQKIFTVNIK